MTPMRAAKGSAVLAAWLLVCLGVAQASTPSSRAGTYTAVSIGSQSSVTAYKYDGAVAANDKAYFVPKALDAVGVYDSAGFRTVSTGLTGGEKFSGGTLAPNGKVYLAPKG